jgi:hypothetical protein
MIPVSNFSHNNLCYNCIEYVSLKYSECRLNQLTSIIFIPLGRHLRFYVINFRKSIIDTDTKSLYLLRMADIYMIFLNYKSSGLAIFLEFVYPPPNLKPDK